MRQLITLLVLGCCLTILSCNKSSDPVSTEGFESLKTTVLSDFVNTVGVPGYLKLDNAATALNSAIINLNTNTTDANLQATQAAWRSMRKVWEQCEGYLFGPAEDNNFDPNMDTWPTDYVQMDSLLNSGNSLTVAEVQNLTLSLRGFHPIEYIIFGQHASRTASEITARQKLYLESLSSDIKNNCHELYLSWVQAPVLFSEQITKAGVGSTVYTKKQEVYITLTDAMIGICEEVGEGKMKAPFDARDPGIVESPYSGNSVSDFRDNIIGLQNVYLGNLGSANGRGISELVALKNKSLDNKLQNQMIAAINSFNNITVEFGEAILSQRVQCMQTITTLATLKETLETELRPLILQYIKD